MDGINKEALSSMSCLMFHLVREFKLDEERGHYASGSMFDLSNATRLEEIVAREVEGFADKISKLVLQAKKGDQDAKVALKEVKGVLIKELSIVYDLEEAWFIERLKRYILKLSQSVFSTKLFYTLFEDIIKMAQEERERIIKSVTDFGKLYSEIYTVYEQYNGDPSEKPYLECPGCLKKTNNYSCAWNDNQHVHFSCEHCEYTIMQ